MTNIASDSAVSGAFADDQLAQWLTQGRAAAAEAGAAYLRSSQMGELMVQSLYGVTTPMLAREGSYWIATNAQGTAINDGNQSSFSATAGCTLCIFNNNSVASGKYIYPRRLKVVVVAVGTSSTNVIARWVIDSGNRFTSGGTALTITNPNLNVLTTATGAVANFGALTTAAATSGARTVYNGQVRVVVPSAGDEYTFEFGNSSPRSVGMIDVAGQFAKNEQVPAIALPPQCSLLLHTFSASQAAARSYDNIMLEYIER
jgi:hypothetical protein